MHFKVPQSSPADLECATAQHALQFRSFMDGPRGLVAEMLKLTATPLPAELADTFAYLVPQAGGGAKSARGSRRSRRGSDVSARTGMRGSMSSVGDLAALDDLADADAALDAATE